ncbi:DUF1579 family protein [Spirosoma pomorum]|jgi:hypothetical protein
MNNACLLITLVLLSAALISQGQSPPKPANTASQQEAMTQLLDFSRPGPNHALLARLVGTWAFQDKNLPFVKGTIVRKLIYEGRFCVVEITGGKLQIPIAEGQMKLENYQGMEIEGYANVAHKFVTTSINNHIGSGITKQSGGYDPKTNSFTYDWDSELRPGLTRKNRKVLTVLDEFHYTEEYYEEQNGTSTSKKVRELIYSRVPVK